MEGFEPPRHKLTFCISSAAPSTTWVHLHTRGSGAANRIRTGDLFLTKKALYPLSYNSQK